MDPWRTRGGMDNMRGPCGPRGAKFENWGRSTGVLDIKRRRWKGEDESGDGSGDGSGGQITCMVQVTSPMTVMGIAYALQSPIYRTNA